MDVCVYRMDVNTHSQWNMFRYHHVVVLHYTSYMFIDSITYTNNVRFYDIYKHNS